MRQARPSALFEIIACGMLCVVVSYAGATIFMQAFLDPTMDDAAATAQYLQQEGVLRGVAEVDRPHAPMNRAELIKLVVIAAEVEEVAGSYCFADVADEWFAPYVCTAKELGILEDEDYFMPANPVSLAEATTILTAAYGTSTKGPQQDYTGVITALEHQETSPSEALNPWALLNRSQVFDLVYAASQLEAQTISH